MQYKYRINLAWSDEDHAWIALVPELPGCFADGATLQEAIEHAQETIELWIDTAKQLHRTIPTPQTYNQPQSA